MVRSFAITASALLVATASAASGRVALFNANADCLKGNYKAYTLSGLKACFACPIGKYQDKTGKTGCDNCPVGTYGPSSARESVADCLSCPGSKYQAKSGMSYCDAAEIECGAGSFITADNQCTKCAPGKYNAYANSNTCYDCPSNHWNNAAGMKECHLCALGKFNDRSGATYCMFRAAVKIGPPRPIESSAVCMPGKWKHATIKTCFNCPAGQYSSTPNAASCTKCAAGTYNPWAGKSGSSDCQTCAAGKTAPAAGSATCSGSLAVQACGAGLYNVEKIDKDNNGVRGVRMGDCAPCPDGTYSSAGQKACQRCAPGYEANMADTKTGVYTEPYHEAGLFHNNVVKTRTAGASSCTPCAKGTYWHQGSCQKCAPGTYNNVAGAFACTACAANHFAHSAGSTSCTAVQQPSDRCTGGRTFMSCASACTKTCDNQSPICTEQCVPRCQCPASTPYWDDLKQTCMSKAQCAPTICPTPRCAAPPTGCHYKAHSGLNADGCKVYPCGLLRCSSTCISPEHNVVQHGWTGPGFGKDWCNQCECAMGTMNCQKKACGPAPACSHLKCKFAGGHVKVTYNKRESVGLKHRCGHLDAADARNCMCTCYD
jgi:hypothetical protein